MIAVSPNVLSNSIHPGADASDETFEVGNSGDGAITYNISTSAQWLSCTPASGSSSGEQDTITVEYFTAALTNGFYNATITITAQGAANSPVEIPVTLTVSDKSPIYRFYSPRNKAHFYTISEGEKYNITVNYPEEVWRYERVAWLAYKAGEVPAGAKPMARTVCSSASAP